MRILLASLFLLCTPAYAGCGSVETGPYKSYDCDGKLGSEVQTGPYTSSAGPLFERKRPLGQRFSTRNVSRETKVKRPKKPRYGWRRYSK